MTTTETESAAAGALAWTTPTAASWPPVARADVGTLPSARLVRITDYIRDHLDGDLTLRQLGSVACMSPFHFARLFRLTTGLSPHRFVVRSRIDRASALLAAPAPSIARISRMTGFRSPSHFSTVFRRITGISPRAYRTRRASERASAEGRG
jgi:AraC family transcriptional regulator